MRRPTKIERLPADVRDLIARLRDAGRTIDEIRDKLLELDVEVARSTLGEHVQKIDAIAARVRESRAAAEAIMARLGEGGEDRTARLNIELMHAGVMQLLSGGEEGPITLDPQSAMLLGRTLRDLAIAARHDTERKIRERKEFAVKAAAVVGQLATNHGLDKATIERFRRGVLGIAEEK
jgi:hypothetical protein